MLTFVETSQMFVDLHITYTGQVSPLNYAKGIHYCDLFGLFCLLHCVTVKHNHNLWRHFVQSHCDVNGSYVGRYWNILKVSRFERQIRDQEFGPGLSHPQSPKLPLRVQVKSPIANSPSLHCIANRLSCFQFKPKWIKNVLKYDTSES